MKELKPVPEKVSYRKTDWERLGKAVQQARIAEKMTRAALGFAIRSSSKSIKRLEEGAVYGDPATAPPGDYNSEKYVIKRLALLEMALEWPQGQATVLLNGPNSPSQAVS